MQSSELNELLKLILLPLLGGLGAWLAQRLKPRPEKQRDQAAADRATFELWRDQLGWARTEIKELRQTVEAQQEKIDSLELRLAGVLTAHADLQTYARQLVRWIKDLRRVLEREPNGAAVLARVVAPLPDLDADYPIQKEGQNERKPTAA